MAGKRDAVPEILGRLDEDSTVEENPSEEEEGTTPTVRETAARRASIEGEAEETSESKYWKAKIEEKKRRWQKEEKEKEEEKGRTTPTGHVIDVDNTFWRRDMPTGKSCPLGGTRSQRETSGHRTGA